MSPSNTFDKDKVKRLTQNQNLANETANQFCFYYKPKWYDHGHYARCQVQDGKDVRDATKRFSVFFPPEIIVKKIPKIETGRTLNIEVIIRANPFNEEKVAKPITDEVR